jgi:cytochrome c-type biogenesis protein CcmH/NrfG
VRLGQHRFAEARDLAAALNKRVPDDVTVYRLLTDAQAELGDYTEAEAACQWMLDLGRATCPALTRAAVPARARSATWTERSS